MKTDAIPVPATEDSPRDWLRAVDRFFFEPVPATIPCLMRIFCGLLILYVHLTYTINLLSYVGPNAWGDKEVVHFLRHEVKFVYPPSGWDAQTPDQVQQAGDQGYNAWSVWYHVEDPFWIYTLNLIFLLAMLFFTVGFCTRISGVVSWIGVLSYCNRLPYLTFGMDAMMVIVVTFLQIAPCGLMYSVDSWLAKKKIAWWRNDAYDPERPPKSVAANLSMRVLQLMFCFVYCTSGLSKLEGPMWLSGEAVWRTVVNTNFAPMQSDLYRHALEFVAAHRWLYQILIGGAVLYTLVVEIGFPALVWPRRTRWIMVTASVLLHTGIGFIMGLGSFSMIMLIFVAVFIPPEAATAFLEQLREQWKTGLGKYLTRPTPAPADKAPPELTLQR